MNLIYKLISLVVILAVCIFAIALAMVNTETVNFNYYIEQIQIPLSLLLVLSFIAGVIISYLILLPTFIRFKILSIKNKSAIKRATTSQLKLINPTKSV
ncbi:MAG: LapA family protein [Pseudomonadota bacterium]